mmetsp:Transcript_16016/g.34767  ORF Transcript_16016/g.34767 Transcript_16016/m.34767 type:complete len:128 (+) Transcript_16016:2624-3007(+)
MKDESHRRATGGIAGRGFVVLMTSHADAPFSLLAAAAAVVMMILAAASLLLLLLVLNRRVWCSTCTDFLGTIAAGGADADLGSINMGRRLRAMVEVRVDNVVQQQWQQMLRPNNDAVRMSLLRARTS